MMPIYRSKLDSPLDANPTKYRGGGLSPLEANPIKYRSRENSPDAAWAPPAGLWAWFKFNEGAGTAIIDYSPLATNGLIEHYNGTPATVGDLAYLWNNLAGFGSDTYVYATATRMTRITVVRNTTYCSLVAFIRPAGIGAINAYTAIQLGVTGTANYLAVGWEDFSAPHYWCIGLPTATYFSTTLAATYGTWYCLYAYSQKNTINTGLYVRASGGAWQLARSMDASGNVGNTQTTVRVFGQQNNPHTMSVGDVLYYADSVPTGIITLAQASDIYDNLKGRYGMS